ncbi:hypothetical protein JHK84_035305 [Glycine max]|nr:hypothetical protein JHK85_035685 [Glycine max]KAG4975532.1 hypothetical protein JHK86_035006 [Glycine max]KAG5128908.1 hypothetical protein JHK84_035305 [Glycine max]
MKQKGLFCLPRNQRGMVFTSLENHHALISPTATEVVNNVVFKIATLKREKAMKMDEILKLRKETDSLLCKAVLESEMSASFTGSSFLFPNSFVPNFCTRFG